MKKPANALKPIVTDVLCSAAQEVIQQFRTKTSHPFLLDAKLGDATTGPMPDTAIASSYHTPLGSIGYRLSRIAATLVHVDQQLGKPLHEIAQRTNDVMAEAAIINRHNRRPPLYAESTIGVLIKLGFATPQHSPLIRAAGYITPPPVVPRSRDIDDIKADIAAHMAQSHEPQSPNDILQSLSHRQDDLSNWPQLDLTLFIDRVAGIRPDDRELYNPDQPWGTLIRPPKLVANTVLYILASDQQPRTTAYLVDEIQRLVGHHLPDRYNVLNAVRNFAYPSDKISLRGPSTFGLSEWDTTPDAQHAARPRVTTGDHIYAFLTEHGPANTEDIIEHTQRKAVTTRRNVQDVINHDPANRFVRTPDRRVVANPFHKGLNPDATALTVIADGQRSRLGPILRQSELLWLTRYVEALNDLVPPTPSRVEVTGARAAGFATDDPMQITVVVDPNDRPSLGPRLASITAATSGLVPSVRPNIILLSPQQWANQQDGESPEAHHNAWLAPHTKQLPNSPDDKING